MNNQVKTGSEKSSVHAFMANLTHPHKSAINQLRSAILGIDLQIVEEIKWNAPSFRLEDHFATFKLYPPKNIQIVLHRGAKPKPLLQPFVLDDQHGIVQWKAADRCVLSLSSSEQAVALENEVVGLIRQWIAQL